MHMSEKSHTNCETRLENVKIPICIMMERSQMWRDGQMFGMDNHQAGDAPAKTTSNGYSDTRQSQTSFDIPTAELCRISIRI
jgi:hypothetical protein